MEKPPSEQQAAPGQVPSQAGSDQSRSSTTQVMKTVAFVAVAAVIAVGAFFGTQKFLLNEDQLDDERRPITAQRGTLLNPVSASGSVEFP